MGEIVKYKHHGQCMFVDITLKGQHREHCLCWRCGKFHPEDREKNCPIANILYNLNVKLNLVTPVWECGEYEEPDLKENGF